MSVKNLLVELFVEELPPKALKKLGESFGGSLFSSLNDFGFLQSNSSLTTFASPRRLAAHITNVAGESAAQVQKTKLMPVSIGLDSSGNFTEALWKKLEGLGYSRDVSPSVFNERISKESDGKSDFLFHTDVAAGFPLHFRLPDAINQSLAKLPIPKVMTYQLADGWTDIKFVRPAHGLVALHGSDIVDIEILGLKAAKQTQGHRFEAAVSPVVIKDADSYEQQMQAEGAVIASFAARRDEIKRQLAAAAAKENLKPIEDEALLDEVSALVERPNVLLGQFETEFLEVPQECLILTMKANQKYFPLLDANGKLTNKFLIVSNISPADPSAVIGGNERVVRPRLADAKFFFDQDRKKTLESRVPGLAKVVYHNKLGTQGERTGRVRAIAKAIAQKLGGDKLAEQADKAALLAKADLLTDMVGEFPELQGIMGAYYARHDGLSNEIAEAIEDHYKPRFSGDNLPRNQVGISVALADKLETLVGMFSIGQIPTGDKDPFALRRHALGIIRTLIEKNLPIDFSWLLKTAASAFKDIEQTAFLDGAYNAFDPKQTDLRWQLTDFIFDRLASSLKDQGYSTQEVEAVLGTHPLPQRLGEIPKCLAAVRAFSALPEAPSLAAANKRVNNILKKAMASMSAFNTQLDSSLLIEPAEIELSQALKKVKPEADRAYEQGDYTSSLQSLAALKLPVDAFFDSVMVNADDLNLRANRLALLDALYKSMNRVADLSKLAA